MVLCYSASVALGCSVAGILRSLLLPGWQHVRPVALRFSIGEETTDSVTERLLTLLQSLRPLTPARTESRDAGKAR
jgi:hypothetical protein